MSKRPYMPFYPSDWRGDIRLQSCSLAARGMWAELCFVMHEADPYGHLYVGKNAILESDIASIARISGAKTAKEAARLLAELRSNDVYSVGENGVIFSRRMVRDEQRRQKNRENGKHGGNPALSPTDNPTSDKGSDNRPPDNQSDKRGSDKPHGSRDRDHFQYQDQEPNGSGDPPKQPPLGIEKPSDIAAYRILDAAWPLISAEHDLAIKCKAWRSHNKRAAKDLADAGKTPEQVAAMLTLAFTHPEGRRWYRGITTIGKLIEHWPKLAALENDPEADEQEIRKAMMRGDFMEIC